MATKINFRRKHLKSNINLEDHKVQGLNFEIEVKRGIGISVLTT